MLSALTDTKKDRALKTQSGSWKRLEWMFEENRDFVWRLLRRFGLEREPANDMTQQAFLIAAERLDDIKVGSEKSFLFGTAIRLARSASRTERRYVLNRDIDHCVNVVPSGEGLVEQRMAIELLDRTLSRMEEDLVAVFVMFELEGNSVPEIADTIGIPLGTAASRLRRAREKFQKTVHRVRPTLLRR